MLRAPRATAATRRRTVHRERDAARPLLLRLQIEFRWRLVRLVLAAPYAVSTSSGWVLNINKGDLTVLYIFDNLSITRVTQEDRSMDT
jgi:hypothetical protein